jgi:phosphatidylglycerophosphatase A
MKSTVEKQAPKGVVDYLSLAITTCGVGYLPLAPGTWGSIVGVLIYFGIGWFETGAAAHGVSTGRTVEQVMSFHWAVNAVLLTAFCLVGIWASCRAIHFFGNSDPSQAVVDEVMGQLITLTFIPIGVPWPFVLAGFLLFRLFDIWKPYPIDHLQTLPGGLGVCADDLVAGVYAGLCLAIAHTVYLFV